MENQIEYKFKPGDRVRKKHFRDSVGVIGADKPVIICGQYYYPVYFTMATTEKVCEDELELFEEQADIKNLLLTGTYGAKEAFSRKITYYKLCEPLRDHIYALFSSKTAFQPYQFKPVLKYLMSQSQSLLLADEVGLGKTIEAGLILTEEMSRKEIERVLVICPAKLRHKWEEEFKRRFNLRMEITDGNKIFDFFKKMQAEGYPGNLQAICSLESLRKESFVEEFQATPPPLDFLIIDESHYLRNSATLSHKLAMALRVGADSTLLLTATPVHLNSDNFLNLLKILSPDQFENSQGFEQKLEYNKHIVNAQSILSRFSINSGQETLTQCKTELEKIKIKDFMGEDVVSNPLYNDILRRLSEYKNPEISQIVGLQRDLNDLNLFSYIMCRTRKRDAMTKQPKRCPEVVPVEFTSIEKKIYSAIEEYVKNRIIEAKGKVVPFSLTMPKRLAASCLPAALNYYLHKADGEENKDMEKGNLYNIKEQLRILSREYITDSKLEALVEKISILDKAEPNRKIVIFAYFISTLEYLEKELTRRGFVTRVIHGKVPSCPETPDEDERQKRITEFREDPEIRILLSSEVGSEGLDFEFSHILFNYDLPWNPMAVEQRIGRLDRYNQESERLLIFNMAVQGTVEERILQRLYDRIGIFKSTIGDLEPILGEMTNKTIIEFLSSTLTPEEEQRRFEEISMRIESIYQQSEDLAKNSAKFVGYDSFFVDEINKARKLKRYLSDEEIYVFVDEFLKNAYTECCIEEMEEKKKYMFYFNKELVSDLKKLKDVRKEYKDKFEYLCYRYLGKGMVVTFSSDIAYRDKEIEYINIHHPLVKLAIRHYQNKPENLHPVSKIQLQSSPELRNLEGDYLFYVYSIKTEGFQSGTTLEPIFLNVVDKKCLPSEDSEILIAEMVASGKTFNGTPDLSREHYEELVELIRNEFESRIVKRKGESKKANEASIENIRINFVTALRYIIKKKQVLLDNALESKKDERYIRMLQGTIRKLEAKLEDKMRELDSKRDLGFSFDEIAAGYLSVK
jgi:superfamily II DNA/RNA helicase